MWQTDRRQTLPKDWKARRKAALERDNYRCTWVMPNGRLCGQPANQVDHIGKRDDHSPNNLRSLCEWHHSRRTSAQGNKARKRVTQRYPKEKHPGVME